MLIPSYTCLYHLMPPYQVFGIIQRTKPHGDVVVRPSCLEVSSRRLRRISLLRWRHGSRHECEKKVWDSMSVIRYHCNTPRTLDITWHPLGQEVLDCLVQVASMKWRAVISVYVFWLTIISDAFVHCVFDWYERLVATISPPGWRSCSLNEHQWRSWIQMKDTQSLQGHCSLYCTVQHELQDWYDNWCHDLPSCSVQF